MRRWIIPIAILAALCLAVALPALAEKAESKVEKKVAEKVEVHAGQVVFETQKCSMCHTVYSAGIGEPPKTDEEKEKALDGPPDLSLAGTGRTAEWLTGFLQKEEKLNDELHMMSFKGTEDELGTLVSWILTLKAPEEEEGAEKAAVVPSAKVVDDDDDGDDDDDDDGDDGEDSDDGEEDDD